MMGEEVVAAIAADERQARDWALVLHGQDRRRLVQRARGYRATIKSGAVVFEHGVATGALSGRLLRGPQAAA